jgi:xanthine permease XanP
MRKPADVTYGVDDAPPLALTVLNGLQHVGVIAISLILPVLVAEAAGASTATSAAMVSFTLLAIAAGTILQVCRHGEIGSGFLCYPSPSVIYFVPALAAARSHGLAMVFGLTIAAGLFEMLLSRLMRRMRPYFPTEIAGLVVLLSGIAIGVVGLRMILGAVAESGRVSLEDLAAALVAFAVMIGLNVWSRGLARMLCVLIGMVVGYLVAIGGGVSSVPDLARLGGEPTFAFPGIGHIRWAFDWTLALPFAIAAVASMLKTTANVTASHRMNDADWQHADMRLNGRGVLADGLATVVAGAVGASGLNSSTSAVGLAAATGVHSRRVGVAVAGLLVVLAFIPKIGILLATTPRPVAGAALLFSGIFIVVSGLETMTARRPDTRRALVLGLALASGLVVDVLPGLAKSLPEAMEAALGTSLIVGTIVALLLNLAFRLGARQRKTLVIALERPNPQAIENFVRDGARDWGARRDVTDCAAFNLPQAVQIVLSSGSATGPLEVTLSFDDYSLDVTIVYPGAAFGLPLRGPTNAEIRVGPDAEGQFAGFLLRHPVDRIRTAHRDGRTTVTMNYEH